MSNLPLNIVKNLNMVGEIGPARIYRCTRQLCFFSGSGCVYSIGGGKSDERLVEIGLESRDCLSGSFKFYLPDNSLLNKNLKENEYEYA